MTRIDGATLRAAATDIDVFARELVHAPLWPHQLDLAKSPARIRTVCSGRQAGKSHTLAMLALHTAFAQPGARILILSAGEEAAKGLLRQIADLASAPLLRGSTVDENRSRITLSTGSEVVCVPASTRQVRGRSVDLLILDEANFMADELWTAASFTVLARPGSRVVMASSPWTRDHFFRSTWLKGQTHTAEFAAFHWPSHASPLVDAALLESFAATMTDRDYTREVLAEWVDDIGVFFTADEINQAVADYQLTPPEKARGQVAAAGLDWGAQVDAHALVLVSILDDEELNRGKHGDELVYYLPWLESHYKTPYSVFIDRIVHVASRYHLPAIVSETNGVGQFPTELLTRRLWTERPGGHTSGVVPIATTARRKMSGFNKIKTLLQSGRLVLPREPELLKQLSSLEYELKDSGNTRIAVPERLGHDDLAMALMQAISTTTDYRMWRPDRPRPNTSPVLQTPAGTRIHQQPAALNFPTMLSSTVGKQAGDGW
ncbi:hypothetical protein H483_0102260 [Dietzia sp. UCD-THP]|uniref:terminase large subunit domain-containing protein n=1 Tax=Dietzia sp. UCD-THP TaxID=1292020 RepID=UPI0003822493|nr:terminase family protein [Dietzia sp. UCD-THP]EYT65058.1 hypothetical protein H483_0102260 [Dietzia sp. UCD-THP]